MVICHQEKDNLLQVIVVVRLICSKLVYIFAHGTRISALLWWTIRGECVNGLCFKKQTRHSFVDDCKVYTLNSSTDGEFARDGDAVVGEAPMEPERQSSDDLPLRF